MQAQTVLLKPRRRPVKRTCMTGQKAPNEWVIKTNRGRMEREAAVKLAQCYLMCAQLTAFYLSRFSAWLNRRPTVQPGLYLGLSCGSSVEA